MYSQANVRAGKVLAPPLRALPSVIVVTEKVMREADGPVGRAALTAHFGRKGDRPGVRLESQSNGTGEEPEDHKRSFKDNWMKELDSEVAGSSKDTQQIQPKPKTQLSRTERPQVDKNPPRRSRKVPCLITRKSSTQQER